MGQSEWGERFLASTRGRIVGLLRAEPRTVSDLAAALELTDNAVRAHLATLERDGLVRRSGSRRGPRKPTITYALSPEAERLFPKEYGPVLRHLLDELKGRLAAGQLEEVVRATGRRFAKTFRGVEPSAGPEERVERAADVLGELGGCCDRASANGTVTLGCSVCPLAVAAEGHPEVCLLVETLLADVVGAPVKQHCQPDPPRCAFEIQLTPPAR